MSAEPVAVEATAGVPVDRADVGQMVFRVAWMAVLLGLAVQLVIVIALVVFGEQLGGVKTVINDTVRTVAWPFIVCVGIAFGKAAAKLRAPTATATYMGIAGLLAAPAAFTIARTLHKALGQSLSLDAQGVATWAVVALTVLKTLQYGFLGNVLGRLESKPWGGLPAHLGAGLFSGVVFGVGSLIIVSTEKAMTTANWISNSINEIMVPIGCALIIFASDHLGKRFSN